MAARMRDHKHSRQFAASKLKTKTMVKDAIVALRKSGLLRDGGKTKVKQLRNNSIVVEAGDGKPGILPFNALLQVSFSSIKGRNDVARAFKLQPRTVQRTRLLMAAAVESADESILDQEADLLEAGAVAFVSGLCADASIQPVALPMIGLEDLREVTKGSWHTMVSSGRYSWLASNLEDWRKIDAARSNVAMVGTETGEMIWNSLYHVEGIAAHAAFELVGLRNAKYPFLVYDVDGHYPVMRAVALRRKEVHEKIGKWVPVVVCIAETIDCN